MSTPHQAVSTEYEKLLQDASLQCKELSVLKEEMLKQKQLAEVAAHNYACACEIGKEREWAFAVYTRIQRSTMASA